MMLYGDSGKELMFFTNGQNATSDTPAITIDTSQNVGIGTTDPNEKFTVSGAVSALSGYCSDTDNNTFFGNAALCSITTGSGTNNTGLGDRALCSTTTGAVSYTHLTLPTIYSV